MENENPMREITVEKVTVNMGVGQTGEELNKGMKIIGIVTGSKPVATSCKVKQPAWGIREGLPIGAKVTLRGKKANDFLQKAFVAKEKTLKKKNFDTAGNFGFGIKEYIDMPGTKYDPSLGIRGMDVLVTLKRPGFRLKARKVRKKKIPMGHRVNKEEAVEFVSEKFGVVVK